MAESEHGGSTGGATSMASGGRGEPGGATGGASGAGGVEDPSRTTCDADPEDTLGTGNPDPDGCKFEGDIILPGVSDASKTVVSVVGFALSTETDELGHYVIEGVPEGTHRLHFRRGDFHETIPAVSCSGHVATVNGTLLSAAPLEVLSAVRFTDGAPLNLAPETKQRTFYTSYPLGESGERPYAVDYGCQSAVALPCHDSAYPLDDGRAVVCGGENGWAVVSVPADATQSTVLFDGAGLSTWVPAGHYVGYVKSGSGKVGVFDVRTRTTREFTTTSSMYMTFSMDGKYFIFTDEEHRLRLTSTSGGEATIVDSLTYTPGYAFTVQMRSALDGSFVAYVPPSCETCELRQLLMDGTLRPLGLVRASNPSFQVSPNSRVIAAELATGEIAGYLATTGQRVNYAGATLFYPAFIAGGAAVTFPTANGTALYATETGEVLDESPAGSVQAATSDGHYLLQMMEDEADASKMKLMLWDTVASSVREVEADFEYMRNVAIAPDEQFAYFVARSGNQRLLRRLPLDGTLESTTVAVGAQSVGRILSFSVDGKLAFDQDELTLRVLLPGHSQAFTLTKWLNSQRDVTWFGPDEVIVQRNGPSPHMFQRGAYVFHVPQEAFDAN